MNEYDSARMQDLLGDSHGFETTQNEDEADLILLNTCSIRDNAEETVHRKLENLEYLKKQNPKRMIGVLGCMAQNLKDDLMESKPFVDIVLGPDSYRKIPEILENRNKVNGHFVDTKLSRYEVYDNLFPSRNEGINAWVSIMRGCDKFCTFCIVPFTRGRERSRSISGIVDEIKLAIINGFYEITLLGQNVNSYNYEGQKFHKLLEAVAKTDGVKRVRYTSPHPSDMTVDVLDVMKNYDNICNYVHLPLQAGNNHVLKRMNRTYTKEEFLNLSELIRNKLPKVGISTDIIVGFPGENQIEFEETLKVMNEVKFDSAFTFKYSSRPGTKAAEFEDHVPEDEKQSRLDKVINLQREHTKYRNEKYINNIENVLIEKDSKRSSEQWAGRTDSNKWVIFDKKSERIGDIVPVKIKSAFGITLQGEIKKIQEMETVI